MCELSQPLGKTEFPAPLKIELHLKEKRGWSGGAMVLGKRPVAGRPTIWIIVGQGPIAFAGCGWGCMDIFSLVCHFSFLTPSLWETDID